MVSNTHHFLPTIMVGNIILEQEFIKGKSLLLCVVSRVLIVQMFGKACMHSYEYIVGAVVLEC